MFLFILESIGTPELILIAVVALIVLGPRKLPQMAKTAAKTMAEFRNATNEFKSTWEREVAFEDELKNESPDFSSRNGKSENENFPVSRESSDFVSEVNGEASTPLIAPPEIRQLSSADIAQNFQINEDESKKTHTSAEAEKEDSETTTGLNKRNWL